MKSVVAAIACVCMALPLSAAMAEEARAPIPTCALSGASSVMIGGQPALRLSDVANCPPELYEVVPSIMVEGQPVVHFRAGSGKKGDCSAKGEATVTFEGEAAQRVGDVDCRQK
ncbi:PAAR domain-containing protein [Ensifer adhaerens]|uniref:PAAR domain-containing protein n=1 Tax=Ensifer adhaerens TaxID=106592 RepID=UPI00099030EE|nr:PAAR domain-containing protein [Ensifer adhaerens]